MTNTFESLGQRIGALVDTKNRQYGDSTNKTGQILAILYPDGVAPEQYHDMMLITRILDKLNRIANGNQGEENAFQDLVGYGLLAMKEE